MTHFLTKPFEKAYRILYSFLYPAYNKTTKYIIDIFFTGKREDLVPFKPNKTNPTTPNIPGIPGPSKDQHSTVSNTVIIPPHTTTDTTKNEIKVEVSEAKPEDSKFLRPNSLPLTPGSFKTKKHVMLVSGDTLVSPDTPRPRKSYMLQYQNGTAYTTLGLKCSTKVYFTTTFKQQPMYVVDKQRISMYSNWKMVTKVIIL